MEQTRPNIVLIMTDEMRGDCMGIAGHPDVQTPYLDSLAGSGIYFPNAYTTCPSCIAARAVLHTGLSPRGCGRVGYQDRVDWNYGSTMAGELAKAGYYTQCVGKMHVHPLRNSLGFHNIDLHDGYLHNYRRPELPAYESQKTADDYFYWLRNEKGVAADVTDTGLDCNSWMARPWIYEEKYHPTNWVTDRGIDFLRRRDPRMPFFLMLSYVRPHAPYDAPQVYFDLYDKPLAPPASGDWDDRERLEREGHIFNNSVGPVNPTYIRRQQQGYYACITHVDQQIGRFVLELIERGLMDNTVILFTSDHGEMLSDHCFCRKSLPYQGSIRVPMFLHGPASILGKTGVTDPSVAALQDVMPTLLELAGAEIPAHLEGRSLLHPGREALHREHSYGELSNHFMVTGEDKYIWFSQTGRERYFRLDTDPQEQHDAIADPQWRERIGYLRSCLIRELEGRPEGYSDGTQLIVGRPVRSVLDNATQPNCG